MNASELQSLCDRGQQRLMATDYLAAETALMAADEIATSLQDFDTLARLYMPLQEARRQKRQRCGEGVVQLNLIQSDVNHLLDPEKIIADYPHGQLLVAGLGTIEPALRVRELAAARGLYVETFLAAAYPVGAGTAIVIVPSADVALPPAQKTSIDSLMAHTPAHCIVLSSHELHPGPRRGDTHTFAEIMDFWERLHSPFLAIGDMTVDPIRRITAYRKTIAVDYACELAHQKLSATAAAIARRA